MSWRCRSITSLWLFCCSGLGVHFDYNFVRIVRLPIDSLHYCDRGVDCSQVHRLCGPVLRSSLVAPRKRMIFNLKTSIFDKISFCRTTEGSRQADGPSEEGLQGKNPPTDHRTNHCTNHQTGPPSGGRTGPQTSPRTCPQTGHQTCPRTCRQSGP
jgi:hypothetical protein